MQPISGEQVKQWVSKKNEKSEMKTKTKGSLPGSALVWLSENLVDLEKQGYDHSVWVLLCFSQGLPCCCWKFYLR